MLLVATTKVVGIPQMVFTNSIGYSWEQDYILTTNELNGYWKVQKCKCCAFKMWILRTNYCNDTNS